jgi:hypothetical protein
MHISHWSIAEIDKVMIGQGSFHVIPSGDKRVELHLRKLHDDYEIVVEDYTAKGSVMSYPLRHQGLRWRP